MSLKAVIFDLDGTILDTLTDLSISLNFALDAHSFPERTIDEVRQMVGNGAKNLIKRAVPEGTGEEEREAVLNTFNEHYSVHCVDNTKPYEGIEEVMESCRSYGLSIDVVSNKPDYGVQTLCADHFPGLIDITVGQKEGVRIKPAPDSVNEVLRLLNITKEEAVYVGDSEVDVQTARNAGMKCIGVEWGFRDRKVLEDQGAWKIVSDMEELLRAIASLM